MKTPTKQSKPLTQAQLNEMLNTIEGTYPNARVELRLCEGDFEATAQQFKEEVLRVDPKNKVQDMAWVTTMQYAGRLDIVRTDLSEYGGTTYIMPHFYVIEKSNEHNTNVLPLACFVYMSGKIVRWSLAVNDKLLAKIKADVLAL